MESKLRLNLLRFAVLSHASPLMFESSTMSQTVLRKDQIRQSTIKTSIVLLKIFFI